jgi:hypothetical protein
VQKTKNHLWVTLAFIALCTVDIVVARPRPQSNYIDMQVMLHKTDKEVWLRTYVAPAMSFKIVEGGPISESSLHCKWDKETKQFADHAETVIVFNCNNGHKLELQMVDFSN